jgi:uncharacterized repeat protein (TIGR03803 family)
MAQQQSAPSTFDINLGVRPATLISFAILATVLAIGPVVPAQTLTALHDFTDGADGGFPAGGLTQDAAGNLYGVAYKGGIIQCFDINSPVGCGVVFKLSHHGSAWVFSTLYEFAGQPDGGIPLARVIVGPDGALYGTTSQGGTGPCLGEHGCGTVFKLQPPPSFCAGASCPWRETILYNFSSRADGFYPDGELVFDGAGNLYGTTAMGGGNLNCINDGCGTVFKLTPNNHGTWTKSTLYTFQGGMSDGNFPDTGVVMDQAGHLYGTTLNGGVRHCGNGGNGDCGVIFELAPSGSGWTETVLHRLNGDADGSGPGQLTFDSSWNLWGPAGIGQSTYGTIFELTPQQGGGWNFSVQYNFTFEQGFPPNALTMDAAGNIYGTTPVGGDGDLGVLYSLTPSTNGWNFNTLYSFANDDQSQGRLPTGRIVLDVQGNIYGENIVGTQPPWGTVWEFTP